MTRWLLILTAVVLAVVGALALSTPDPPTWLELRWSPDQVLNAGPVARESPDSRPLRGTWGWGAFGQHDQRPPFVFVLYDDPTAQLAMMLRLRENYVSHAYWPVRPHPDKPDTWLFVKIRRERPHPSAVVGRWEHAVNGNVVGEIYLRADGEIDAEHRGAMWEPGGLGLVFTWPREGAPGDPWVDDCWLAADGSAYIGWNQHEDWVVGRRLD